MKRLAQTCLVCSLALGGAQAASAQVQGQWTATGALASPREFQGQLLLKTGKMLAVGGGGGVTGALASAELYNPNKRTWAATGAMAGPREAFAIVALANGKILVAGGWAAGAPLAASEIYDPAKGTWSSAGAMATARYYASATLLPGGKVLVAGGCAAALCATVTPTAELYNPANNSWSATGPLNIARDNFTTIALADGEALAVGGAAGVTTELYNPATGLWTYAASVNFPRFGSTATALVDGKVLVTGGTLSPYTAELYDPVAKAWSVTGAMPLRGIGHSAARLADGTVVVSGGLGLTTSCGKLCVSWIPTYKAVVYNEATGAFSAAASLPRALAYHVSTALASGQALATGGIGYGVYCCQVESNAEVYTPLTLSFSSLSLNYGLEQIGVVSPPQTVTVTNASAHNAAIAGIAASGDYAQANACPATLSPGQQCAIAITFTPTAAGTRAGGVTLTDDSPGSPTQTIALTGVGEATTLGFSPASLLFPTTAVGLSAILTATLVNDGATPLTIASVAIAPSNKTYAQSNTCPATLNVQQSCTFQVVFTPPDVFTYKATLTVTDSAGAVGTLTMKGTGGDGVAAAR